MASGRYDSRLKVYKNGNWYNAKSTLPCNNTRNNCNNNKYCQEN